MVVNTMWNGLIAGTHFVVMLCSIPSSCVFWFLMWDSGFRIGRSLQNLSFGYRDQSSRSTLSDFNKRRPEIIFESIYCELYVTYRNVFSSDSRTNRDNVWMKCLQVIDSTTIPLFSNLLFKGVGRHPKSGKKKGGIKVHTVIHANEEIPLDIKFTSTATTILSY